MSNFAVVPIGLELEDMVTLLTLLVPPVPD